MKGKIKLLRSTGCWETIWPCPWQRNLYLLYPAETYPLFCMFAKITLWKTTTLTWFHEGTLSLLLITKE